MMKILPLFALPFLLLSTPSSAKGHGGHGGGGGGHHGGGGGHHSSGGGHAAARSSAGGNHAPARSNSTGGSRAPIHNSPQRAPATNGGVAAPRQFVSRRPATASRGPVQVANPRAGIRTPENNYRVTPAGARIAPVYSSPYYTQEHWGYYNPYYGYSPYYGYPGYAILSFGAGFYYTPHYGYAGAPYNSGYNNNNDAYNNNSEVDGYDMQGFVVYERDTIQGIVTMEKNKVEIQNIDSGKHYDYSFKTKKAGLTYITLYESDSSNNQLNLVRLQGDKKNLWRVVHEGKLNIYDKRRGFIYSPDDVDMKTIKVVYNGQSEALYAHSVSDAKRKLTEYVNTAYGSNLDARNFTWKELLVYIDKLD